jgi:hypothetical protein
MTDMSHSSDHDPITKSRHEADRFNVAWLKNGEKLTSFQRIGFGVFSLFFLLAGCFFGAAAVDAIREGHMLGACGWSIPTLIYVIPGVLGIRNVLRF